MKRIITAIVLTVCLSSFAQYSYKGKAISESKFNELYSSYSKFLFVYKDEVFDFMDNDGNLKKYDGKSGILSGSVDIAYKKDNEAVVSTSERIAVNSERVISNSMSRIGGGGATVVNNVSYQSEDKRYLIINLKPDDYAEKISIPAAGLDKVKENYNQRMDSSDRLASRILPITKEQFIKYLADGNSLFKIEKSNDVYAACGTCGGSGKIKNPQYNRKRMDSKEKIACGTCNGSGKTLSSRGKNIKVELQ